MNFKRNNPLNIKYDPANNWLGQLGNDDGFCIFKYPHYGFRAAYMLLQTYVRKYGLITPERIISRWAPTTENPTKSYINYVTNLYPKSTIQTRSDMCELLAAMACFESGLHVCPAHVSAALSRFGL